MRRWDAVHGLDGLYDRRSAARTSAHLILPLRERSKRRLERRASLVASSVHFKRGQSPSLCLQDVTASAAAELGVKRPSDSADSFQIESVLGRGGFLDGFSLERQQTSCRTAGGDAPKVPRRRRIRKDPVETPFADVCLTWSGRVVPCARTFPPAVVVEVKRRMVGPRLSRPLTLLFCFLAAAVWALPGALAAEATSGTGATPEAPPQAGFGENSSATPAADRDAAEAELERELRRAADDFSFEDVPQGAADTSEWSDSTFTMVVVGGVTWHYHLAGERVRMMADLCRISVELTDELTLEELRDRRSHSEERAEGRADAGIDAHGALPSDSVVPSDGSVSSGAEATASNDGEGGARGRDADGGDESGKNKIDLKRFRKFAVYLEGHVRFEVLDRDLHLEADSMYFEHPSGVGIARGARLSATVERAVEIQSLIQSKRMTPDSSAAGSPFGASPSNPFYDSPLVIRAAKLRMYGLRYFIGDEVEVSNSHYAVPPVALRSRSVEVYPVDSTAAERERLRQLAAGNAEDVDPTSPSAHATAGVSASRDVASDRRAQSVGAGEQPEADSGQRGEAVDPKTDLEEGATESADEEAERVTHFIIDPESTWITVLDRPLVPLPLSYWDTRWHDYLPIREAQLGSSSELGAFGEINWNLNYFLRLLPYGDSEPAKALDRDARLGFSTLYSDRRGFGYGPNAVYGQSPRSWAPWQTQLDAWTLYGEGRYFTIDDRGDEDRTTRMPIPRDDRFWGTIAHRQAVPHLGLFDFEYSDLSDRAFLGEYYEDIAKQEKEQETLVYWRRNFRDNLALTGLAQFRTDNFVTQTERLPEAKAFVLQQPVFGSGLYTDLTAQAARLRPRPDDALGLPSRGFERYDLFNSWAYPLHLPFLDLRPFSLLRYSYYDELADPAAGSEDRGTVGGGITLSQEWRRVFDFEHRSLMDRLFDVRKMKHVIVPSVTYLNVASNDLDPARTIPVDDVDTVDLRESVSLSLRNELLLRRRLPGRSRQVRPLLGDRDALLTAADFETFRLFESDVSLVVFPRPQRDNAGDEFSRLRLDNAFHVRRLSLRLWSELNPNRDFRMERLDLSTTLRVVPERLLFTVGDRLTRSLSNILYVDVRAWLSEKWAFSTYWSHDTDRGRGIEVSFAATRMFHRFAVTFEFVEDVGEDRNRSFFVNVSPLELFRARHVR